MAAHRSYRGASQQRRRDSATGGCPDLGETVEALSKTGDGDANNAEHFSVRCRGRGQLSSIADSPM